MTLFLKALLSLSALAGVLIGSPAHAEAFPNKPFRLLVGFPPGSTGDAIARAVGTSLTKQFGVPAVVENRAGANGALAAETVARSAPDGYTLLVSNTSSITVNPLVYDKLSYAVPRDFTPITTLITYPLVLTVNPSSPKTKDVKTVNDLFALGRTVKEPLTFGSGGNGNLLQLASEQLIRAGDIKGTHVPYRGGAPMQMALLSGEIDFDFDTLAVVPLIKSGKLRALAVTERQRWEELPDVPTVVELGLNTVELSPWIGLLGPAGMSPEIVEKIYKAAASMGDDPAIRSRLQQQGRPTFLEPKDFAEKINRELSLNRDIVKKADIHAD